MRELYGFGIQPDLLTVWHGDPDRFPTFLALANEELIKKGREKDVFSVAPPIDFYAPNVFDSYIRSLQSKIVESRNRLYFGKCKILKTRLKRPLLNDPAIMAIGGLIHTLLSHCAWMDADESSVFNVDW